MAYRLIVVILPAEKNGEDFDDILKRYNALATWHVKLPENKVLINVLIRREKTETILNFLQKKFSKLPDFRIILMPVEASIPIPESPVSMTLEEEKEGEEGFILQELLERLTPQELADRLSRQEIYSDVSDISRTSNIYIVLIILSSIVGSIGVLNNNVAVIIGAMVIAPLLGPNVALSLATVLGDVDLALNGIKTTMVGIFTALVISMILGFTFPVDTTIPELLLRTQVGLGSVTLALASGIVGALALIVGFRTTLIGVMVAVALLPPLVSFGLLLASENFYLASGALLLFLVNLVCINLAGVITFYTQKIKPIDPVKKARSKKMTYGAIIIWVSLLIIFIFMILARRGVLGLLQL
ncbi:MAG: TIGR00341 family protein [Methanomicrobiales archaeon]